MAVQDLSKEELIKKVVIYSNAEKLQLERLFQLELENYKLKKELLKEKNQLCSGMEPGVGYDGRVHQDGRDFYLDKDFNWFEYVGGKTKFLGKMEIESIVQLEE